MKKIVIIIGLCAGIFTSCNSSKNDKDAETVADTTLTPETESKKPTDPVTGKLALLNDARIGQPINIKFMVYNHADTVVKFCKWHTPFEKLSSKYLDVSFENHTDIDYKGVMAKRIMPPPADSYMILKKGDSIGAQFNLADAYAIDKAGQYTIKYNSTNISGIVVSDSLNIKVGN